MGQTESLSSLNAEYDLQKDPVIRPECKHKAKYFKVIIEKGMVEKISIDDPDLTVGWLLSEVSRKYNDNLSKKGKTKVKKEIVGIKCAMFYPTLDSYLQKLDNVLAPIRHKTTFVIHFAQLSHHQESFINRARIGPDDFQYLKVIGRGSYSHVIVSRKRDSGKLYAIKIIKKKLFKEVGKETFISESEINKKFQDTPFVIDTYYAFQTEEEMFLVMELCPGGTLFEFLKRLPGANLVNLDIVRFYIAEIIISLEFVHAQNVMYRDLKPENILIDIEGHIKLSDFGLSKELETRNQMSETFCGSPEYLAPEMVFGQKHTRTLDFYTLGCLAYEIMFGYPPFYSENHHDLSQKLLNEEVYFPKQVDKGAKDLIKWLLEKDPESRPSEFSEVKNHPFFEKVHWGKLARREVAPPFVPDLYKVNFERCFLEVPISQALNFKSLVEERKGNDKTITDKNASNRNTNYKNYAKSVKLGRLSRNVDNELSITVQKENDPDWIEEFNFEVHPESEIIIRKQLNLAMKENLYPRCESAIPLQTYYTGNCEEFDDEVTNNDSCIILKRNINFKFKEFNEENDIFFQETRYNSILTNKTQKSKNEPRKCSSSNKNFVKANKNSNIMAKKLKKKRSAGR